MTCLLPRFGLLFLGREGEVGSSGEVAILLADVVEPAPNGLAEVEVRGVGKRDAGGGGGGFPVVAEAFQVDGGPLILKSALKVAEGIGDFTGKFDERFRVFGRRGFQKPVQPVNVRPEGFDFRGSIGIGRSGGDPEGIVGQRGEDSVARRKGRRDLGGVDVGLEIGRSSEVESASGFHAGLIAGGEEEVFGLASRGVGLFDSRSIPVVNLGRIGISLGVAVRRGKGRKLGATPRADQVAEKRPILGGRLTLV